MTTGSGFLRSLLERFLLSLRLVLLFFRRPLAFLGLFLLFHLRIVPGHGVLLLDELALLLVELHLFLLLSLLSGLELSDDRMLHVLLMA